MPPGTLVEERQGWRNEFELAPFRPPQLEDYISFRESNTIRMSAYMEKMLEYILYLEDKLNEATT